MTAAADIRSGEMTTTARDGRLSSRLLVSDWSRPHWRILYYHGVAADEASRFREHLQWFSRSFRWCSFTEGLRAVTRGPLTGPLMSLSFDDAEESVHRTALPILQELNIPACVFVVPAYVLEGTSFRAKAPQQIMSWGQIREWAAAGHEVGSHTYTHADVSGCRPERQRQELLWSKQAIEDAAKVEVAHFAYPWGRYSSTSQRQIRELGCYRTVSTTRRGRMRAGHDPLRLRRDLGLLRRSAPEQERLMRMADHFYWCRYLRWNWLKQTAISRWNRPVSPALASTFVDRDGVMAACPVGASGQAEAES